jgi:hypothetical protein
MWADFFGEDIGYREILKLERLWFSFNRLCALAISFIVSTFETEG